MARPAPHNRVRVPNALAGDETWQTESWALLCDEEEWAEYKERCDRRRFGAQTTPVSIYDPQGPQKPRSHNHGSFCPERYPCLVWSFNVHAAVLQHKFVYADDITALVDRLDPAKRSPRRERLSPLGS